MLAVAFDTLKLARKLESAGMQPKQAQETSAALSESFSEWLSLGNIATREDVQAVREDVHKLATKLAETKGELKAEIVATKAEIMRWMLAQTVVLIGAMVGILHLVLKS
jgi:capsule polysaccharide export protein KpsE/RkpR